MDPLSVASAWAVRKITDSAIQLATDKAKEVAKSFWDGLFASAHNEVCSFTCSAIFAFLSHVLLLQCQN